jgi:excisionase family DNA binding protein
MSAIVTALLTELDDDGLDELARLLAPRLAAVSEICDRNTMLTTARAAQRAGLHERSIRRALAAGTLAGHTIAGRWRITPDDLDNWLELGAPTSTTSTHDNGRAQHRGTTTGADAIAGIRRAA